MFREFSADRQACVNAATGNANRAQMEYKFGKARKLLVSSLVVKLVGADKESSYMAVNAWKTNKLESLLSDLKDVSLQSKIPFANVALGVGRNMRLKRYLTG